MKNLFIGITSVLTTLLDLPNGGPESAFAVNFSPVDWRIMSDLMQQWGCIKIEHHWVTLTEQGAVKAQRVISLLNG